MKMVLEEIRLAKQQFARLPLFERMRSEALSPRRRLAFFPCLAPFVLAYSDLRSHVFRDEGRRDRGRHPADEHSRGDARPDAVQDLVHAHCGAGSGEWACYLDDLASLGFDHRERAATEVLRQYASDSAQISRMLGPRLARLLFDARPIEKLLMLEAIGAARGVLFSLGAELASRLEREYSLKLRYFSQCLSADLHDRTVRVLGASGLADHERAWCLVLVGHVFQLFTEWSNELLAHACSAASVSQPRERAAAAIQIDWPVSGTNRV